MLVLFQNSSAEIRNDLRVGRKGEYDVLQIQEFLKKDWSIGGNVEAVFSFTNSVPKKISYIEILDQATNGHGAKPSIIRGGVGYNFVDIKFRSEVFRGINFLVNVYA